MEVNKKWIAWAKKYNRRYWWIHKLVVYAETFIGRVGGVQIEGKAYGKITKDVRGGNNQIIIGKGTWLNNPTIRIRGRNNKIVFGDNCKVIGGKRSFWMEGNDIEIIIGNMTSFNHSCHFCVQEDGMSVCVGERCMIANTVIVRTSDSHGIFELNGDKRINPPKSVKIGDHVWLAPKVLILKGVNIGSGSIVGSNSVVTKDIPSNCLAVGQPAKVVKNDVRWSIER